jgi:hypothetical protein
MTFRLKEAGVTGLTPTATRAPLYRAVGAPRYAFASYISGLNKKSDLLRLCARIGYTPH